MSSTDDYNREQTARLDRLMDAGNPYGALRLATRQLPYGGMLHGTVAEIPAGEGVSEDELVRATVRWLDAYRQEIMRVNREIVQDKKELDALKTERAAVRSFFGVGKES